MGDTILCKWLDGLQGMQDRRQNTGSSHNTTTSPESKKSSSVSMTGHSLYLQLVLLISGDSARWYTDVYTVLRTHPEWQLKWTDRGGRIIKDDGERGTVQT